MFDQNKNEKDQNPNKAMESAGLKDKVDGAVSQQDPQLQSTGNIDQFQDEYFEHDYEDEE